MSLTDMSAVDKQLGETGKTSSNGENLQVLEAQPGQQQQFQFKEAAQAEVVRPLDTHAFTFLDVFSLAFSCINSWVVLVVGLGAGLVSGGPTARESKSTIQYHQGCYAMCIVA